MTNRPTASIGSLTLMEITYEVTPDDVVVFAKFSSRSSWWKRSTWLWLMVAWLAVSLLSAWWLGRTVGVTPPTLGTLLCVGALIGVPALVLQSFQFVVPHVARRAYVKDSGGTNGPASVILDGGSIRGSNATGYNSHPISIVSGIEETPDHVFILLGRFTAYAIRRDSVTSGDLDAFVTELRERMGED